MKTLAFQVAWDLWSKLRQTLHELERINPQEAETPTMRALCTALLLDGLQHRKVPEILQLTLGQQIKKGRPVLQPMNKQYEKSKEETRQERNKRLGF